jgi:hypothetical protein
MQEQVKTSKGRNFCKYKAVVPVPLGKNTFNLFDVTLEGGIQGVSETSNYKVSRVMIGGDVRRQVCSSPSYKVHGGMFSGL